MMDAGHDAGQIAAIRQVPSLGVISSTCGGAEHVERQ